MTLMAQARHFAGPPHWTWYIVPSFFLAGLSGGCYALATLLRLRGERWDEPAARLGYYAAFATFVPCPVLLTLDLTQPLRFWHMLWNTTPGAQGFNFRYWSPMSVGSWALVAFGLVVTVTFVEVLVRDQVVRRPLVLRAERLGRAAPAAHPLPGGGAAQRRRVRHRRAPLHAAGARAARALRAHAGLRGHVRRGLRLPLDPAVAGGPRRPGAGAARPVHRAAGGHPRRGRGRPVGARRRGHARAGPGRRPRAACRGDPQRPVLVEVAGRPRRSSPA